MRHDVSRAYPAARAPPKAEVVAFWVVLPEGVQTWGWLVPPDPCERLPATIGPTEPKPLVCFRDGEVSPLGTRPKAASRGTPGLLPSPFQQLPVGGRIGDCRRP